jgi:hypothetical protein
MISTQSVQLEIGRTGNPPSGYHTALRDVP